MKNSREGGFTLIELIVVIVILGILAAFAVPRFMGMEREARIATLNALAGSLRSSSTLARGVWLAQGSPAAGITVDGNNIVFAGGYPNTATVQFTVQDVTANGFQLNAMNPARFEKVGATTVANCYVQYNNAMAPATPVIQVVPGGC